MNHHSVTRSFIHTCYPARVLAVRASPSLIDSRAEARFTRRLGRIRHQTSLAASGWVTHISGWRTHHPGIVQEEDNQELKLTQQAEKSTVERDKKR